MTSDRRPANAPTAARPSKPDVLCWPSVAHMALRLTGEPHGAGPLARRLRDVSRDAEPREFLHGHRHTALKAAWVMRCLAVACCTEHHLTDADATGILAALFTAPNGV